MAKVNISRSPVYPVVVETVNGMDALFRPEHGIYLANENAMIDTERIDLFDSGKVGPQSANPIKRTGDKRVLALIDEMQSRTDSAYFPGTFLRQYGHGIVIPTMPVIVDGKLVLERAKQTGLVYVDDRFATAKELFGEADARTLVERGPHTARTERDLEEAVRGYSHVIRKSSMRSVEAGGYRILPVICNELTLIPRLYNGKPVNLVLHSAQDLFLDDADAERQYINFGKEMVRKGLAEPSFRIALSQMSSDEANYHRMTRNYVFEHGKLKAR